MDRLGITKLVYSAVIAFALFSDLAAGTKRARADLHQWMREIWIELGQKENTENGLRSHPFHVSGEEQFDAIMRQLTPGTHVHLGEGVFMTRGVRLIDNCWIEGSGKDGTTIKLVANIVTEDNARARVLYNLDYEGFHNFVCVSDLTLDCNREKQPAAVNGARGNLDALTTATKNARIVRVRALGTWANPGEGFPFSVLSSGSSDGSNRVEIESCENLNPRGSLTAISAFDQTGGRISGFIRNCIVTDDPDGAAFGAGGWKNFDVSNNITHNMSGAVVIDTHDYENVVIAGNHFYGTRKYGILYNGHGKYKNIVLRNNLVVMDASAELCVATSDAPVSTVVRDNLFIQASQRFPAFFFGRLTRGSFRSNVVRENVRSDFSRARDLSLVLNRDERGKKIAFPRIVP